MCLLSLDQNTVSFTVLHGKITGTNNHLSKTEIIETSINSLFNESELKNKSKTAFQKEMKELIKNQKNEFAKFL